MFLDAATFSYILTSCSKTVDEIFTLVLTDTERQTRTIEYKVEITPVKLYKIHYANYTNVVV